MDPEGEEDGGARGGELGFGRDVGLTCRRGRGADGRRVAIHGRGQLHDGHRAPDEQR